MKMYIDNKTTSSSSEYLKDDTIFMDTIYIPPENSDVWNIYFNLLDNKHKKCDIDNKHKKCDMILPDIIHETKNNIYVAKFPDGTKDVDILKPNHGDEYDLEKGLLYYIIKKNFNLDKVLKWMRPILDEKQCPKNIEKHKKQIESKIKNWFMTKNDNPINDKECQKIIDNRLFVIESKRYNIGVNIKQNGIVSIFDKKENKHIPMIKSGFPPKGFLRHLIYNLYKNEEPTLEYYQLKKLTYKFYKGCFDSVAKTMQ